MSWASVRHACVFFPAAFACFLAAQGLGQATMLIYSVQCFLISFVSCEHKAVVFYSQFFSRSAYWVIWSRLDLESWTCILELFPSSCRSNPNTAAVFYKMLWMRYVHMYSSTHGSTIHTDPVPPVPAFRGEKGRD